MALSRWDDERDGWSYDDVFSPDPMGSSLDTDRVGSTRPDTTDPISTTPDLTGPTASADPWRDSVGGMYEKYLGRSAGEEDYAASRTNPGGLAGIENTVKNSREAQGYTQVSAYQRAVQDLGTITDPTQRAVKRDQLARDIYNNLRSAGHDVKWNGDTLVVDGREYVIAGANDTGGGAGTGTGTGTPTGQTVKGWGATPTGGRQEFDYQRPDQYLPGVFRGNLEGFDLSKLDPSHPESTSAKMIFARAMENIDPYAKDAIDQLVNNLNSYGVRVRRVPGSIDLVEMVDTGEIIDVQRNASYVENPETGSIGWAFMPTNTGDDLFGPGGAAGGPSIGTQTAGITGAGAGAGGVATNAPGGGTPPPAAPGPAPFTPSAPTYTPGEISMDDLEGLTYDKVMRDIGGDYVPPELGDFGPLGAGAVEDPLEASVLDLLRNPESLDPRTVETMKAKSKEEEVALWEQERDALDAFGARNNISDSNWLGSERQGARRDRDERLIRSNRDIDIRAAETNKEDRRKAISAGDAFATSKATRNQNEASFRRQTAQQNIDNQFKSREDKRQAIKLASDTQLAAAIERGDRLALREQINQKAVELGQSADRIMLDYTLGLIADATDRYGIDVGAQVDREKLAQAGREFQEELAFRIWSFSAQLAQDDSQFGANWRLNAGRLQLDADNAAWDRYRDIFGD